MTRTYPLYFDHDRIDGEVRVRRISAAFIIALHVFVLAWILLSPAGRQLLRSTTDLIVVELGDAPRMPASAKAPVPLRPGRPSPAAASRAHAPDTSSAPHVQADASQPLRPEASKPPAGAMSAAVARSAVDPAGAAPASTAGSSGALHAHFRPPRTLHAWLPPYPEEAFRRNNQGTVDLLLTIDADGTLVAAHVDRSSGDAALDRAALESLDRYTFRAAERDGIPTRADAIVTINWIITPAIVERFSAPAKIERIDPLNLTGQRKQTQYGSYLQALQRERERDPDSH